MAIDLLKDKGCSLDRQKFTWRDMVKEPISKLNDDAFTRVRIILMNGLESDSLRFQHACAKVNGPLQRHLARLRQVEQRQQTMVNWLLPPDQTPLETTLGFEQVAIEVTASVAQNEPNLYLAQTYRFGLLEDFDHLYRYSALYDRVEGKDANTITQSYTDIRPGRPTVVEHRHSDDNLRAPYERETAQLISKLNAATITAAEHQTHDYYMTIGPCFADPVARLLYAEIAAIEEQHVTQYECLMDPAESWLEKWLLHEAMEVYNYYGCVQSEVNPRIKALWERFLDYELGHLAYVRDLFENIEQRDVAEVLDVELPEPIQFQSQRKFVRQVLSNEVDMRTSGTAFVKKEQESPLSLDFRKYANSEGSPSETIAQGYVWRPGGELNESKAA